jgi:hypothetical protein
MECAGRAQRRRRFGAGHLSRFGDISATRERFGKRKVIAWSSPVAKRCRASLATALHMGTTAPLTWEPCKPTSILISGFHEGQRGCLQSSSVTTELPDRRTLGEPDLGPPTLGTTTPQTCIRIAWRHRPAYLLTIYPSTPLIH